MRFLGKHPNLARALRYTARIGVCANSVFLALYVLLPISLRGGVELVEPITVLRWGELGVCSSVTVLGIVEATLAFRKERRK